MVNETPIWKSENEGYSQKLLERRKKKKKGSERGGKNPPPILK